MRAAIVHYWLLGSSDTRPAWVFLAALAVGVIVRWRTGSAALLIMTLGSLSVVSAIGVSAVIGAPKFVAGLFRLCPYLVFALLPHPPGRQSSTARQIAQIVSVVYLAFAFAGLNCYWHNPIFFCRCESDAKGITHL